MKETIYTIPINDCFNNTECECPICLFEKKEESDRIEYTLGASMMEPDSRIITNEKGFCIRHIDMLYNHGNRLSLDLILQTHIDTLLKKFDTSQKDIEKAKDKKFGSKDGVNDAVIKASNAIKQANTSCAVCEKLDWIMDKFISNLFYMIDKDVEFENKFFSSKGFCMRHFSMLIEKSVQYMPKAKLKDFTLKLFSLQKDNYKRIYDDVEWFAKKHDYRFQKDDWKTSKDAVERASMKVCSFFEIE